MRAITASATLVAIAVIVAGCGGTATSGPSASLASSAPSPPTSLAAQATRDEIVGGLAARSIGVEDARAPYRPPESPLLQSAPRLVLEAFMPDDRSVRIRQVDGRCDVLAWHDEDMRRGARRDVADRDHDVVPVDGRRGDLTGHDAAEEAIVCHRSPFHAAPSSRPVTRPGASPSRPVIRVRPTRFARSVSSSTATST